MPRRIDTPSNRNISNFSKYETVSGININMPGIEDEKAINVCFRSDEVFNHTRYIDTFNRYAENDNELKSMDSFSWGRKRDNL